MSKKAFKKAIGGLYKQKVIWLKNDGIYLANEGQE
jgi:predicted RNA-binding protein (virulence factor B family)